MYLKNIVLGILIVFVFGCEEGSVQGSRILGMDLKEIPSVAYDMAYDQAITMGVREVSISLDWALLEPSLGSYDNTLPEIIDTFYPNKIAGLTLILRPLDTAGPSVPSELTGLSYDDPVVISAFEKFLANLHAQLPTVNASGKIKWIHVGNEIDAYLGDDAERWMQWQTFVQAAKLKINSLWGSDVDVSSIVQFSTFSDANILPLYLRMVSDLDSAVITYYPLNVDFTMRPVSTVEKDFELMVNTIPGKSILIQECGYPSSSVNNSSETVQADFVSAVFAAWDTYMNSIQLIDFSWQYDLSPSAADQWVIDYGMSGSPNEEAFRAFLLTLGLGNFDGTEKEAMQRLRDELQLRSWEIE